MPFDFVHTGDIIQLDGLNSSITNSSSNASILSSSVSPLSCEDSWFSQDEISVLEEGPCQIPVHVGFRPPNPRQNENSKFERCYKNNITVKRDNRLLEASSLPTFSVYNMRSLWSKLSSLGEDMKERATDLAILSEVWEQKESTKHKQKIEELLELHDISYISTARPGAKRGGGAAIVARHDKFHVSKLNIDIPKPLEIVWALLRPKDEIVGNISKIIICSFYSPPRSRKKTALLDHIAVTINKLKTDHPKAAIIIAGDKNDLNEKEILMISPALKQIVLQPTRKDKTLTIVITDLHRFYQEPRVIPPVPVDSGEDGVPSDHQGVLVIPLQSSESALRNTKKIKIVRPIPQSSLDKFSHKFALED